MNVCVYCASQVPPDPVHQAAAERLGQALASEGHTLVYGGGGIGLMGVLARSVHAAGGRVVGVIPRFMTESEKAYAAADDLVITDDMRQRKAEMERRADAFVVLTGGLGTLEELFEILVSRYLAQHEKPVVIVNVAGFFDPLLTLLERMIEAGVAKRKNLEHLRVVESPEAALRACCDGEAMGLDAATH